MIVLGISNAKDSGACLMVDGCMVAAVNEERFSREKLTREFPRRSIQWIMSAYGLRPADIDAIGTGVWKGPSYASLGAYVDEVSRRANSPEAIRAVEERCRRSIEVDTEQLRLFNEGLKENGLDNTPIFRCHHHHAHALSAFCFSPFEDALVVTLDGRGDFCSGSVTTMNRAGENRLLRLESEINSLGYFYGWITQLLGFIPDRHEGKVTGLAAHGCPEVCRVEMQRMISHRQGTLVSNPPDYYGLHMNAELPLLREALSKHSSADIAAAAQAHLEELVVAYVNHYLTASDTKNLCVAGGIFANVLVNLKLQSMTPVEGFFVFPHMGDGGIAAGGAAYATKRLGGNVEPLESPYLGPCESGQMIEKSVAASGFRVDQPGDYYHQVATHVNAGAIVGHFSGRMEYGPRALGNRSVVAKATDPSINTELNRRLARTETMPFAPVTLKEYSSRCYPDMLSQDVNAYHMTACFRCSDDIASRSPAVVHLDGTARPQIVSRDANQNFYDLLNAYHEISSIPTLINTSFNTHEEPLVNSIDEALAELRRGSIDVLAAPPFIVTA